MYLRLYIAVGYIQLMKSGEAFEELTGDSLGVPGGTGTGVFKVVGQVAMLDVFHCDEDEVGVRVPPKKFDKKIIALDIC